MAEHLDPANTVIVGIDTHADVHVAAAINGHGQLLGTLAFTTDRCGFRQLLEWATSHGRFCRAGVEGTSSYGAGLSRYLRTKNIEVLEIDRPNRQRRRRKGKSDTADAEAAARAVLSQETTTLAKDTTGRVEAIRMLHVTRKSAVKAKVQAGNQIKDLIVTAPEPIKDQLKSLNTRQRVRHCAKWRPTTTIEDPTSALRYALWNLARRWLDLDNEIKAINKARRPLLQTTCPRVLNEYGVGDDVASALVIAAGQNINRLKSEASFAALCGTSPIDASSGKNTTHRLNRGGNRAANCALHTIMLVRWRNHEETHTYITNQRTKGKPDRHIQRKLKRALARRIHHHLQHDLTRTLT